MRFATVTQVPIRCGVLGLMDWLCRQPCESERRVSQRDMPAQGGGDGDDAHIMVSDTGRNLHGGFVCLLSALT